MNAYIIDGIRTPIGRYGGALAGVRPDDMAAHVLHALIQRTGLSAESIDDVMLGCANQAGEDNRNVARMGALLAGFPETVSGTTINRLCGSGLDAVGTMARSIVAGELDIAVAGGVESMSRAPFVMGKAESAFSRAPNGLHDTTIGWRFINPKMAAMHGVDSMPETAENVAADFNISRQDQDAFAFWSQSKAQKALEAGWFANEITPIEVTIGRKQTVLFDTDEHPRLTPIDKLAALKTPFKTDGSVTAGNASGVNDGAAALLLASADQVTRLGLTPRARVLGMATAGVASRVMGIGPVPAVNKLMARLNLTLDQMDLIELNEAFAAQALAVTRQLGLADDDPLINPLGGAIALGHPLGMSGARLVITAMNQLERSGGRLALCTMCVGVGQGIALVIERIEGDIE